MVLRFALPDGPIVSVEGTTRWSKASGSADACAIGVALERLPPLEQDLLEDFVKRAEI